MRAYDGTYLGEYTCSTSLANSIFNKFGLYGSDLGIHSIWNELGLYGSKVGLYSPFNPISISPPEIVDGVTVVDYLTVNDFFPGGIHPLLVVNSCFLLGSLEYQYWENEVAEAT